MNLDPPRLKDKAEARDRVFRRQVRFDSSGLKNPSAGGLINARAVIDQARVVLEEDRSEEVVPILWTVTYKQRAQVGTDADAAQRAEQRDGMLSRIT